MPIHDDVDPSFLTATLDALAKETKDPVQAAQLRALAHLDRTSSRMDRRMGGVENRMTGMEKAIARIEALEGKILKIEKALESKEAAVRGAWWATTKIAIVGASAVSGLFALYQHFFPNK